MTVELKNTPYVFLSYSHNDKDMIDKIYKTLSYMGFHCWIDEKIRAMENFNSVIEEAIENCTVFLSFFSKSYVEKPYCQLEYDCATNNNKSKVVVCIDDVSPNVNPDRKYMFSYYTGLSIIGYGTGISDNDESISSFCSQLAQCPRFNYLKRFMACGDWRFLPPITATEELMACARLHVERQYHQNGNYVFSDLSKSLFPEIVEIDEQIDEMDETDSEFNHQKISYVDNQRRQVSLISYLTSSDNNSNKNIFLIGEGGNGKTISLLQTSEYLLNQNRCAIYIPLKELNSTFDIDQYVYRRILNRNNSLKENFESLLKSAYTKVANVIFLLDGVNEVETDEIERILHNIRENFFYPGYSVQFIITSRYDSRRNLKLKEFALLELQPLSEYCIKEYLKINGLSSDIDSKLLSVIQTPLLLTLYANTEKYRVRYQHVKGIELEKNPNTVGKVLKNFFQTQLYRASEEVTFNFAEQLVILEFLLPSIAHRMIKEKNGYIGFDEALECADEIESNSVLYSWYKKNRLRKINRTRFSINIDYLLRYAEDSLHFIHETDQGYEFIHQSFRDYFAAYYIANEILAIESDNNCIEELNPSIVKLTLDDDLLKLISDILKEEESAPKLDANGWVFPGKSSIAPSEFSYAEQILDLWRDIEGDDAQNAVYNLLRIMKFGRNNSLAWCDFSRLDLRKCWLNGCRFVEWYEDKMYPSKFDGAWINRESFITNGHGSQITSVCTNGKSNIFSGDVNGTVKVYDLLSNEWMLSLQLANSPVIDMAWDAKTQRLAILYANILFVYSLKEKSVISSMGNENLNKCYRYVRFAFNGTIQFSYDLEPLLWYAVDGTLLPSDLSYDVPSKCACWHPTKKEFIRSNLLQLVSLCQFNETTQAWEDHPVLKKRLLDENKMRAQQGLPPQQVKFISLREDGDQGKGSVNSIDYNADGTRFIVAIQNFLIEYDSVTLLPLHKKELSAHVKSVCYGNGNIIVASGTNILILDEDFTESILIQGTQIRPIRVVVENYDGNGYYLISDNGEIKKLDLNLRIQKIRKTTSKSSFVWAKDRRTERIQMAFLPNKLQIKGVRYTYETSQMEPLGWCYKFMDSRVDTEEQRIYPMGNRLLLVNNKPPYNKIIYENYSGLYFFGCSFKEIRGNLSLINNQEFIRQNGGVLDDFAQ